MDKGHVAQRLLRLVMAEDKAASIAGDLLEQVPSHGVVWFWRSLTSLLVRRLWRPVLAFPLATVAGLQVMTRLNATHTLAHPAYPLDIVVGQVSWVLTLLAIWSLIRYGWRDVGAQIATAFTAVMLFSESFRWLPFVMPGAAALLATLLWICGSHETRRRHLLALVLALPLPWIGLNATFYAASMLAIPQQQNVVNALLTFVFPCLTITAFASASWARRIVDATRVATALSPDPPDP